MDVPPQRYKKNTKIIYLSFVLIITEYCDGGFNKKTPVFTDKRFFAL
jgi:uncharacterized Fe-S center protein